MAAEAQHRIKGITADIVVLIVHFSFCVFMAGSFAAKNGQCVRLDMAALAIVVPLILVLTGVDGEILRVVVEVGIPIICVVAVEAGGGESRSSVFVVVVALVACDALLVVSRFKNGSQVGGSMARSACNLVVRTDQVESIGGERMLEHRTLPLQVVMARFTLRRKAGGHVVHAEGIIVIDFMAGHTGCFEWGKRAICVIGMTTNAIELCMGAR